MQQNLLSNNLIKEVQFDLLKLQSEAAQVGFEASIVGASVYIASEFQYFRFDTLGEAKAFLRSKRNEKLSRLFLKKEKRISSSR